MEDTMNTHNTDESLKIFACSGHSINDAPSTIDQSINNYKDQINDLEKALIGLFDIIASDPGITLRTWQKIEPYESLVESILDRREEE